MADFFDYGRLANYAVTSVLSHIDWPNKTHSKHKIQTTAKIFKHQNTARSPCPAEDFYDKLA